jgi:hypothetical protein
MKRLFRPNLISDEKIVFPCGMSRSGTTLLTTIIDSHSMVSMGYELIPPELPKPGDLLPVLKHGLSLCQNDFSKCGQALRNDDFLKEGLFFTRCYRAGLGRTDIVDLLHNMQANKNLKTIKTLRQRLEVACMIAKYSANKRNLKIYGFKLNIPSVINAFEFFPNSSSIYILRDPRDVVASHIQRNFNRTINDICKAWNNYLLSFERFCKKHQQSGMIILYEDIVKKPEIVLPKIFKFLSLPIETSVFEFYKSKAGVHQFGHPNADNLKKDFFSTSVDRWKNDLNYKQLGFIEKMCRNKMHHYGYN